MNKPTLEQLQAESNRLFEKVVKLNDKLHTTGNPYLYNTYLALRKQAYEQMCLINNQIFELAS